MNVEMQDVLQNKYTFTLRKHRVGSRNNNLHKSSVITHASAWCSAFSYINMGAGVRKRRQCAVAEAFS